MRLTFGKQAYFNGIGRVFIFSKRFIDMELIILCCAKRNENKNVKKYFYNFHDFLIKIKN